MRRYPGGTEVIMRLSSAKISRNLAERVKDGSLLILLFAALALAMA